MSDVRFWRRFHQWLRLGLLYTVVWSKHHFENFQFWAKIKHPFKPCALIPIVGEFRLPHARTGGVLIVAHRRVSTLTQYFTWFGKTAYIHGRESILLEIYRERITTYMEEEDHFTPSSLWCSNSCCNGSKAAAITALSFSPLSCTHSRSHSLSALSQIIMPLYRHFMVNMEGPVMP